MFNEHQQGYMDYLSSLPADAKCACGWYRKEECDYAEKGIKGYCSRKYLFLREKGVEWIQQCAIMDGDKPHAMWPLNRHHDIIRELVRLGRETPIKGEQGFLTSTGRFVDRIEARKIALACGQIEEGKSHHKEKLFSEDLW
jgi:hypothetical protein